MSNPAVPQPKNKRRLRAALASAWKSIKKSAVPFMIDLVIVAGTGMYFTRLFMFIRAYDFILFALLLRWKRFDGNIAVRIVFGIMCLLFIDTIFLSLFPLLCITKAGFWFSMLLILSSFYVIYIRRGFNMRTLVYSMLPSFFLSVIVVGSSNQASSYKECRGAMCHPGIEALVDLTKEHPGDNRGFPRNLAYRPDKHDFLIIYRSPTPFFRPPMDEMADRYDLVTHRFERINAIKSECIGIYYDQRSGQTLAVVVNKLNHEHPKSLLVLDADLKLIKTLDYPGGDDDDYTAYFFTFPDKVGILSETDEIIQYDPKTLSFAREPIPLDVCGATGRMSYLQMSPSRFLISGGGSPLFYSLTFGPSVCSYNLEAKHQLTNYKAPLGGSWDIAEVPDRHEILATSVWLDKTWVINSDNMKHLRTLEVGSCFRSIAYNPENHLGYAVECFTGNMVAFDIQTGEIKQKEFVGKNSRKIYHIDGIGMIILSSCGIFRIK